jgi:uncharacterized OB-fold protein
MAKVVNAAQCKKCGKLSYPTHFYCPECGHTEFEAIPIKGEGTLLTWTRSYALPIDYAQLYLGLGIVQMDMGLRVTGQLALTDPKLGMRVKSRVDKVRDVGAKEVHGLVFDPA